MNASFPSTDNSIAVYEMLRKKLRALYRRDQFEIHDKVLEFHDALKAKYPNYLEYRLYHLISGSTLRDHYGALDFPAPDSIQVFIEREYREVFGDADP